VAVACPDAFVLRRGVPIPWPWAFVLRSAVVVACGWAVVARRAVAAKLAVIAVERLAVAVAWVCVLVLRRAVAVVVPTVRAVTVVDRSCVAVTGFGGIADLISIMQPHQFDRVSADPTVTADRFAVLAVILKALQALFRSCV
jgi:hypothetical protein